MVLALLPAIALLLPTACSEYDNSAVYPQGEIRFCTARGVDTGCQIK